jgi:NAD+ synthase (glutamine-hydrolysing)
MRPQVIPPQVIGQLRVGLAQINPTVGNLEANSALILENAGKAASAGAHLLVFPEMALTGYPVEDLANRASFRTASKIALNALAKKLEGYGDLVTIVGYLEENESRRPQNAVAVIHSGKVLAKYIKHHLPNYGVFDEFRNFAPGEKSLVVRIHGIDVGIAICEDIWREKGPVAELASRSVGLVVVPNGSPYEQNKVDVRASLVRRRAREIGAPLLYVNMTGGQDDLVFDGDSIAVSASAELIARAPQFDDGLMFVDIDAKAFTSNPDLVISEERVGGYLKITHGVAPRLELEAEIWQALVVGLRDYVKKNGFSSVILGLSGGIDSAITAVIAADALGPKKVFGVALPSQYSSDHSLGDAAELARRIGLNFRVVEIAPMVNSFLNSLGLTGLAELYGDAVGGYAPIKDLFKSEVWALAKWRNQVAISRGEQQPIPTNSITKEPSAELRPDQKDSDSLPPYDLLDQLLTIYIENDGGLAGLLEAGFDRELATKVIQMVDRAEYKRRQYPPGPKISRRAFGKDRRLPITSGWREN